MSKDKPARNPYEAWRDNLQEETGLTYRKIDVAEDESLEEATDRVFSELNLAQRPDGSASAVLEIGPPEEEEEAVN